LFMRISVSVLRWRWKSLGIMNQFSLFLSLHSVSELAAFAQALITLGSPSAQPSYLSSSLSISSCDFAFPFLSKLDLVLRLFLSLFESGLLKELLVFVLEYLAVVFRHSEG
jgi:hypothetical protein